MGHAVDAPSRGVSRELSHRARAWVEPQHNGPHCGRVELQRIELDLPSFLASQHDLRGAGPITLPDGSVVPRLPGYRKWIWDDDFAGLISVRWQPSTAARRLLEKQWRRHGKARTRSAMVAGLPPRKFGPERGRLRRSILDCFHFSRIPASWTSGGQPSK